MESEVAIYNNDKGHLFRLQNSISRSYYYLCGRTFYNEMFSSVVSDCGWGLLNFSQLVYDVCIQILTRNQ